MIERLKRFNWVMFLAMIGLIAIGTDTIRCAGAIREETVFHGMWLSNLFTAGFGMILYFVLAFTDYRKILFYFSLPAYAVALALLVAVLCFGSEIYGGKRWLWFFQPSEIAKLSVIVLMAAVCGDDGAMGLKVKGSGFKPFLIMMALVSVPCSLILMEPDLGTTLTLVPASLLIMFVARIWRRGLVSIVSIGVVAAMTVIAAVYEAERPGVPRERRERILKFLPLQSHQVKRVKVFLFPDEDIQSSGYNLRQSKISIGSGGFRGQSSAAGSSDKRVSFLPKSISMNDFIFCVYAERRGYVGSLVLLGFFAALLLPICWIAFVAADGGGRLLSLGVAMLLFAHVYINIAMAIGLVPITGLPLPFISSGRTFLIVAICALGLVQSVSVYREN